MSAQFDLAGFIRRIRPDLGRAFPQRDPAQRRQLLLWLLDTGRDHYRAVEDDAGLRAELGVPGEGPKGCLNLLQYHVYRQRKDVRKVFPLPARLAEFYHWYYTHGVDEHGLWALLSPDEQRHMLMQPAADKAPARSAVVDWLLPQALRQPLLERPFGVNVIGPLQARSAMGAHARHALEALESAEIACSRLDTQATPPAVMQGDYLFNLYCMSPTETGRLYAERGAVHGWDRYNIGYWPWQQARWPATGNDLFALVDEVWVTSSQALKLLRPLAPVPVLQMPAGVAAASAAVQRSRKKSVKSAARPPRSAERLQEILAGLQSSDVCAVYPRNRQ